MELTSNARNDFFCVHRNIALSFYTFVIIDVILYEKALVLCGNWNMEPLLVIENKEQEQQKKRETTVQIELRNTFSPLSSRLLSIFDFRWIHLKGARSFTMFVLFAIDKNQPATG